MFINSTAACVNPKVTTSTYSTNNVLMSSETVFIVEVNVECDGADVRLFVCVCVCGRGGGGGVVCVYLCIHSCTAVYNTLDTRNDRVVY